MHDWGKSPMFGAQLFVLSSISAVANYCVTAGRTNDDGIPERIFKDWRVPQATGYGQSKFVSERLLDAASREANIPAVVCRLGQVAGPTTAAGIWLKKEWLPGLIAGSKYLGKLPASLGRMEAIDWIPVDVLGQCIVELPTTIGNSTTPTSTSEQTGDSAVSVFAATAYCVDFWHPETYTAWCGNPGTMLLRSAYRTLGLMTKQATPILRRHYLGGPAAAHHAVSRSREADKRGAAGAVDGRGTRERVKIQGRGAESGYQNSRYFEGLAREEGGNTIQLDTKNTVWVPQTLRVSRQLGRIGWRTG
ncbi:hypothetical protein DL767_001604 [Monosporascus sp. MG133]|nr:hypothetical protein DL767_001604 [Monosporascus sp. MG133]